MQQLILPLNDCKLTAAYKNKTYKKAYGFEHYGCDYAGGREVIAGGTGIVYQTGFDRILGNTVAVVYPCCTLHDKSVKSLTLRYCHLERIDVKRGQVVVCGERIGITGQTPIGKVNGIHLHLEVDTDVNSPLYTPTISTHSNVLRAGYRGEKDTTFAPAKALFIGEGQKIYRAQPLDEWTTDQDVNLPMVEAATPKGRCEILVEIVRMLANTIM